MTLNICICCGSDHDLRRFPQSPISADRGQTCICRACYGGDPQEPDFETLPKVSGSPAALPRPGGENSPGDIPPGAF